MVDLRCVLAMSCFLLAIQKAPSDVCSSARRKSGDADYSNDDNLSKAANVDIEATINGRFREGKFTEHESVAAQIANELVTTRCVFEFL